VQVKIQNERSIAKSVSTQQYTEHRGRTRTTSCFHGSSASFHWDKPSPGASAEITCRCVKRWNVAQGERECTASIGSRHARIREDGGSQIAIARRRPWHWVSPKLRLELQWEEKTILRGLPLWPTNYIGNLKEYRGLTAKRKTNGHESIGPRQPESKRTINGRGEQRE
jgi:hypothetical protein